MKIIAQIVGILAVMLFALSYQPKKRSTIVVLNASSRTLYVLQYILLGAISGATLDVIGLIASIIVGNKTKIQSQRKNNLLIYLLIWIFSIGLFIAAINQSIIDILPVIGVCFQITALWSDDPKKIRIISLLSAPFWLSYNIICGAYGSVAGDVLGIISIIVAMIRTRSNQKHS